MKSSPSRLGMLLSKIHILYVNVDSLMQQEIVSDDSLMQCSWPVTAYACVCVHAYLLHTVDKA